MNRDTVSNNFLHLAICDDRRRDRQRLLQLVERYIHENGLMAQTDEFDSGEALLAAVEKQKYDLVFLDIYMEPITGIETAERLRRLSNCAIIFVTTSREHALEGFELNASHYLVKPVSYESVSECFRRCGSILRAYVRQMEILSNRETVRIREADITYIEVFGNQCIVHTLSGDFDTYTSLNSLYERLDQKRFLYPHRSYVVNLSYINKATSAQIELKNGICISVSRSERAGVKQRYIEYLLETTRSAGGRGISL